jgi:hypothetical protein
MPTVTLHRSDLTSPEVVTALKERLGPKYTVEPRDGNPSIIRVEASAMSTCRVRRVGDATGTRLHVHGGGFIIGRIVGELSIADTVARPLRDAGLDDRPGA